MQEKEMVKKAAKILLAMQRHNWEQGTAMQAFLEMGEKETVIAMAYESVYRSLPDGRCAMLGGGNAVTDPCSVGEALIWAVKWTEDPFFKNGLDKLLEWALHKAPRNEAGVVYHMVKGTEFWADSFYMLPPFLTAAGYYKEAMVNLNGYWDALYDSQKHLLRHRWNDGTKEYTNPAHWGTGNGWTLAAFARMIPKFKAEGLDEEAASIAKKAIALLDGVLEYMLPDGLFHNDVDDESTFVEVALSMMTAYTIFRGLKDGWLEEACRTKKEHCCRQECEKQDAAYYLAKAELMKKAAEDKCNPYGVVCDACGAPRFDRPGCSPEAQAFFLLMEQAAEDFYSANVSQSS